MRDVLEVARDLIGARVTRRSPEGEVTVRLTEVEAYRGDEDPASHAFRGPSERNRAMFSEGGHLYVYRHLGLHHCMNLVTGPAGQGTGILLRAGEVVDGTDLARRRRTAGGVVRRDCELASGPGRLTVALGVDLALYGTDVCDPEGELVVRSVVAHGADEVSTGPRVGVAGPGGDGARYPWRFWLTGDPTVSAYRAVMPRAPGRAR